MRQIDLGKVYTVCTEVFQCYRSMGYGELEHPENEKALTDLT